MKLKTSSIEFFGLPGSGKTFIAHNIREYLKINGYKVFNTRECIIKWNKKKIRLNFFERCNLF